MLSFPASPYVGQRFQGWVWDSVKWAPAKSERAPRCGRLQLGGASPANSLTFIPFKGDDIKINGLIYKIPAAGLTATQGSLYLNKVAGSTLAPSTRYYVYVFFDGTTLQLNFSTTGRATSTTAGNVGTEICAGDDSQTLVGITFTAGGSPVFFDQAVYRYVRSWFNRPRAALVNGVVLNNTATTPIAVLAVLWIAFSDDSFIVHAMGVGTASVSSNIYVGLLLNGVGFGAGAAHSTPHAGSQYVTAKAHGAGVCSEQGNNLTLTGGADYAVTFYGTYNLIATLAGTY